MKLQNEDFNLYFYQNVKIPFFFFFVKKLNANNFNFNQVPDYNTVK